MSIGTKLKALRFSIDISEEELAQSVGVTEEKIKFWEKDLSRPNNTALSKIAEFFKIDMDFFFEEDNPKEKHCEHKEKDSDIKPDIREKDFFHIKKEEKSEMNFLKSDDKSIVETANDDKIKNFKQKIEAKRKSTVAAVSKIQEPTVTESDSVHIEILNELKTLNEKLDNLLNAIKNKPELTNIRKIESTYSMDNANKLLKDGWVLLELFKDEKGILGYRLGRTD
ncbi:MAG TPA: helix-turn-helix transcriptional regulator [bacterium]|nr:helix-turn-helix transcriptional regulator [bacterium]HPN31513.1 helix-turn-helix transcriptional regulator [bacterium]